MNHRFSNSRSHSQNNRIVDCNFYDIIHETDKAWLIAVNETDTEGVWLPKSQAELDENTKVISLPKYLADQKGLDYTH